MLIGSSTTSTCMDNDNSHSHKWKREQTRDSKHWLARGAVKTSTELNSRQLIWGEGAPSPVYPSFPLCPWNLPFCTILFPFTQQQTISPGRWDGCVIGRRLLILITSTYHETKTRVALNQRKHSSFHSGNFKGIQSTCCLGPRSSEKKVSLSCRNINFSIVFNGIFLEYVLANILVVWGWKKEEQSTPWIFGSTPEI